MPLESAEGKRKVKCKNCNHEHETDFFTTYIKCPYCGRDGVFYYMGTIAGKFH